VALALESVGRFQSPACGDGPTSLLMGNKIWGRASWCSEGLLLLLAGRSGHTCARFVGFGGPSLGAWLELVLQLGLGLELGLGLGRIPRRAEVGAVGALWANRAGRSAGPWLPVVVVVAGVVLVGPSERERVSAGQCSMLSLSLSVLMPAGQLEAGHECVRGRAACCFGGRSSANKNNNSSRSSSSSSGITASSSSSSSSSSSCCCSPTKLLSLSLARPQNGRRTRARPTGSAGPGRSVGAGTAQARRSGQAHPAEDLTMAEADHCSAPVGQRLANCLSLRHSKESRTGLSK